MQLAYTQHHHRQTLGQRQAAAREDLVQKSVATLAQGDQSLVCTKSRFKHTRSFPHS